MGMPEYGDFTDICVRHDNVRLDTTMVFTPFAEETMPVPTERACACFLSWANASCSAAISRTFRYDYAAAMTAITTLDGIDDDWLRGVFHDNAARLFGLASS